MALRSPILPVPGAGFSTGLPGASASSEGVGSGVRSTSLGKNRDTPPSNARAYRPYIRQAAAQRLVSGYWSNEGENLRGSSVAGCGRWKAHGAPAGVAQIEVDAKQARMTGHFICGCNWTCEMCARATVARNRSWLRGALFPALHEKGLSGTLVTLTLAHSYNEAWDVPVAALKKAFGLMDRRMAKVYKKAGSVGKFKAFEVTVGMNGLHPHLHILLTHDKAADLEALEADMKAAWFKAVEEAGGRCTDRGFDFQPNRLNDYAAKMEAAHELSAQSTKLGRKKGKTLSQLLDMAAVGDLERGAEWQRAIAALGSTNRFHAGNLAKKLGIPSPSEWEDEEPEEAQAELELEEQAPPLIIEYALEDHLRATHPALGRPGLAMILRAAKRGGRDKALSMVRALCDDYARKRLPHWMATAQEPWSVEPGTDVMQAARERPLNPAEVREYLRIKETHRASYLVAA